MVKSLHWSTIHDLTFNEHHAHHRRQRGTADSQGPQGLDVRPTPDLVKQAVFNSLGARVAGARVLELFAGSGALSLECLSRGAVAAMCIEKSHKHAEFIRSNARTAGYDHALEVRVQDVFTLWRNSPEAGGNLI